MLKKRRIMAFVSHVSNTKFTQGCFHPGKWKTYDAKFTSEQIAMRTYPFHLGLNSVLSVASFLAPLVLLVEVAGCGVSGMTTTVAQR